MRSRRLSLDQWRSSRTSATGPTEAAASTAVRHAPNIAERSGTSRSAAPTVARSEAAIAGPSATPRSWSQASAIDRWRSGGVSSVVPVNRWRTARSGQ